MKLRRMIVGLVLTVMNSGAEAATIERTFTVEASNFVFVLGPDMATPVDPADLTFTLIFDPSAIIPPTTTGLTVDSFNLDDPSAYSLSPIDLVVASDPTATGCVLTASTYCFFIVHPGGADPRAFDFGQMTADTTEWEAQEVSVSASAAIVVPEPSTFVLMLAGFGGLGLGLMRRQVITVGALRPVRFSISPRLRDRAIRSASAACVS
jgi:PEP-CTERM motif